MTTLFAATVREEVADFVSAAFSIYVLIIIIWIVSQLLFSLGVRPPYSRVGDAILDFLRDCSEPFLRIFRRLGLSIGPIDLSPLVALIVLQVAAALIVGAIRPG